MEQPNPNHWRQLFERTPRTQPNGASGRPVPAPAPSPAPLGGYDDGYQPPTLGAAYPGNGHGPHAEPNGSSGPGHPPASYGGGNGHHGHAAPPLSPADITDEAAMSLALDQQEYRPWILQRGTRPVMMLHLRRFEPKSGLWMGWQLSYPQLIAAEYVGDKMLSLDFGTRQFMIEGHGLVELAQHLQQGTVLVVQEYAAGIWPGHPGGPVVSAIRRLGMADGTP